jgi:hypothetical protein
VGRIQTYGGGFVANFSLLSIGDGCSCLNQVGLRGVGPGTSAVNEELIALAVVCALNQLDQAFLFLTFAWVVGECEAVGGGNAASPWGLFKAQWCSAFHRGQVAQLPDAGVGLACLGRVWEGYATPFCHRPWGS